MVSHIRRWIVPATIVALVVFFSILLGLGVSSAQPLNGNPTPTSTPAPESHLFVEAPLCEYIGTSNNNCFESSGDVAQIPSENLCAQPGAGGINSGVSEGFGAGQQSTFPFEETGFTYIPVYSGSTCVGTNGPYPYHSWQNSHGQVFCPGTPGGFCYVDSSQDGTGVVLNHTDTYLFDTFCDSVFHECYGRVYDISYTPQVLVWSYYEPTSGKGSQDTFAFPNTSILVETTPGTTTYGSISWIALYRQGYSGFFDNWSCASSWTNESEITTPTCPDLNNTNAVKLSY